MSEEKTAVITGGKGILGSALAKSLRKISMPVLAPASQELDVSSPESVKHFFSKIKNLDLLVCNAGIVADKTMAKMTEAQWDTVMAVNLRGVFLCAREGARMMAKARCGHIILISSFSAFHPPFGQANYGASKAALHGITKSLAQELGPRNVRVNTILPGYMQTKLTSRVPENVEKSIQKRHALGRFNTPDRAADFIVFLHQNMPHTSGQIFNLDSRII